MPDPTKDTTGAAAASDGFEDASAFFDGPLVLPIRGKTYTLPEVDFELGLAIAGVLAGKKNELTNKPADYLYQRLCGDVWGQMLADGLPGALMIRVGETAMTDFTQGRDMAQLVWRYGISPEALAATKAATQTPTVKAPTDRLPKQATRTRSTRSRSSATATATPSPASTSGTRSPKATPRAPRKKAPPAKG